MNEPDRILRFRSVSALVGLKRSAIYKHIRAGNFPKPVNITTWAVGWRESEITAWIASRAPAGVSVGVSSESNAA